jgi:hypothetical protein
MMKRRWMLLVLLLLGVWGVPYAQEPDCSVTGLQRTVDLIYSNYATTRDDMSDEGAYQSAEVFVVELTAAVAACEPQETNETTTDTEATVDVGAGTLESPYAFGYSAETPSVTVTVLGLERDADAEVAEVQLDLGTGATDTDGDGEGADDAESADDDAAPVETEYVIATVEIECPFDSRDDCIIDTLNFAIQGSAEDPYPAELVYIEDLMLYSILPGRNRVGRVPIPVNAADGDLLLVFYPFPNAEENTPIYFELE